MSGMTDIAELSDEEIERPYRKPIGWNYQNANNADLMEGKINGTISSLSSRTSTVKRTPSSDDIEVLEIVKKRYSSKPKPLLPESSTRREIKNLTRNHVQSSMKTFLGSTVKSETLPAGNSSCTSDRIKLLPSSDHKATMVQNETLPTGNARSETLPAGNARSETLSAGNARSETLPAGNARSETLPAGNARSKTLPAGNVRSETLSAGNAMIETFPAGNARSKKLPAGNARIETLPAGNARSEKLPAGNARIETLPTGNARSETLPAGNARSETLSAGNARSETLPACNARSKKLPAENARSKTLPAGNARSETLPAGNVRSETLPAENARSKTLPAGNARSETLPAGNVRSETLPAGNARSETFAAGNARSEILPAGNVRSETLPACNARSKKLPAGNVRSEKLPAGNARSETLAAGNARSEILPAGNVRSETLTAGNVRSTNDRVKILPPKYHKSNVSKKSTCKPSVKRKGPSSSQSTVICRETIHNNTNDVDIIIEDDDDSIKKERGQNIHNIVRAEQSHSFIKEDQDLSARKNEASGSHLPGKKKSSVTHILPDRKVSVVHMPEKNVTPVLPDKKEISVVHIVEKKTVSTVHQPVKKEFSEPIVSQGLPKQRKVDLSVSHRFPEKETVIPVTNSQKSKEQLLLVSLVSQGEKRHLPVSQQPEKKAGPVVYVPEMSVLPIIQLHKNMDEPVRTVELFKKNYVAVDVSKKEDEDVPRKINEDICKKTESDTPNVRVELPGNQIPDRAIVKIDLPSEEKDNKEEITSDQSRSAFQSFLERWKGLPRYGIDDEKIKDKLWKYYYMCHTTYTHSRKFINGMKKAEENMSEKNIYEIITDIKNNLKTYKDSPYIEKKKRLAGQNEGEQEKVLDAAELKRQRQLIKLESRMMVIEKKIKEIDKEEVDLNDEDNSSYLLQDRLKTHFLKLDEMYCRIANCSQATGRPIEKKFRYEGSRYPEINSRLTAWVNKHREFPDYKDVLDLVRKVTKDSSLPLRPETVRVQAQEIFRDVGKILKDRREKDDFFSIYAYAEDEFERDPAENDLNLQRKLKENENQAKKKLDSVFQHYVDKEADVKETASKGEEPKTCEERTNHEEENTEKVKHSKKEITDEEEYSRATEKATGEMKSKDDDEQDIEVLDSDSKGESDDEIEEEIEEDLFDSVEEEDDTTATKSTGPLAINQPDGARSCNVSDDSEDEEIREILRIDPLQISKEEEEEEEDDEGEEAEIVQDSVQSTYSLVAESGKAACSSQSSYSHQNDYTEEDIDIIDSPDIIDEQKPKTSSMSYTYFRPKRKLESEAAFGVAQKRSAHSPEIVELD